MVAIGALFNNGSGHVRIYKNVQGVWIQLGTDIDGEAAGDYSGSSVSLSADGSIVAIEALFNNGSGHVRIYENIQGTWTQLGADIDGEATHDESGVAVSLSADGNIVAIGARNNDGNGTDSGHVCVYKNIQGIWSKIGNDIDGVTRNINSGVSVSLSADGNLVAIGAYLSDVNKTNSGQVRIYKNVQETWIQLGAEINGEGVFDLSGQSVSLSADGNIVAIGAYRNDGNGTNSGHVRVYENIEGTWTKLGGDIDGEAAVDFSGISVSLSEDGNILAVGAHVNDGNGTDSGHVRVYKYITGTWTQLGTDIDGEAAGDQSGVSVSLSADGNIVAIGARNNNGNGESSGHVRIYEYIDPTTLSTSRNTIEGLVYTVLNGSLITNQKDVSIYITDVLGKTVLNKNLQGIYIVHFVNSNGEAQINKLLIE